MSKFLEKIRSSLSDLNISPEQLDVDSLAVQLERFDDFKQQVLIEDNFTGVAPIFSVHQKTKSGSKSDE